MTMDPFHRANYYATEDLWHITSINIRIMDT